MMRIKRLILLAILALVATCLVSCSEPDIGSALKDYDYHPTVIEDVTLEMYLIVGDETAPNAIKTIQEAINKHTKEKYHTTLNIHFLKEAEYDEAVTTAVNGNKADIVLINSTALMETFTSANKLADLASYLDTTNFGKLNTTISATLLNGAYTDGKLYAIPNDHVVGEYEYVKINTAIAQGVFNYNDDRIAQIDTPEKAEALWQDISAKAAMAGKTYEKSEVVAVVSGNYQERFNITDAGWACNVYKLPEIDADEVNSGAFAITSSCKKQQRAMEIVYSLSTDAVLRNLLLYGEEGKNYTVDADGYVVPVASGDNVYRMNVYYTGSFFNAYYTKSDVYDVVIDKDAFDYGKLQNDDAVMAEYD